MMRHTPSLHVFAGVLLAASLPMAAHDEPRLPPALARTAQIHGAAGPFAVAGYRMGEAALRHLKLQRGSMDVEVIHYSPAEVQWSCIIDGLQAATGASVGKLNLRRVDAAAADVHSVVRNRKTGEEVRLSLTPEFVSQHMNLPPAKLMGAGTKVVALPAAGLFTLTAKDRAAR